MMLRSAVCLLLLQQFAGADEAQRLPDVEKGVLAAYQQMQQADRQGDMQLWFKLRDRQTLDSMDAKVKDSIRKGGRSRPAVQYEVIAIRVRGNRAVLIGKVVDPQGGTVQYNTVLFCVEDQDWKITREQWSQAPFDPFVLSAWMPPEDGAFLRAGSLWKGIPYATPNIQVLGKQEMVWKMQATVDESFLYVRFEANARVAAPGSKVNAQVAKNEATGGLPPPPPMRIKIAEAGTDPQAGPREFSISVSDLVSTHKAFDIKGKAEAKRFSVAYSLFVKNGAGEDIFENTIGESTIGENTIGENSGSRLLAVQGRFIDIKLPLSGMRAQDPGSALGKTSILLEESDSVLRVLPYKVQAFAAQ